jgi:hypothetical protein
VPACPQTHHPENYDASIETALADARRDFDHGFDQVAKVISMQSYAATVPSPPDSQVQQSRDANRANISSDAGNIRQSLISFKNSVDKGFRDLADALGAGRARQHNPPSGDDEGSHSAVNKLASAASPPHPTGNHFYWPLIVGFLVTAAASFAKTKAAAGGNDEEADQPVRSERGAVRRGSLQDERIYHIEKWNRTPFFDLV